MRTTRDSEVLLCMTLGGVAKSETSLPSTAACQNRGRIVSLRIRSVWQTANQTVAPNQVPLALADGSARVKSRCDGLAPPGELRGPVVLLGKSVTFDSGGVSFNPADDMDFMKFDMTRAAAVIGAFLPVVRSSVQNLEIALPALYENTLPGFVLRRCGIVRTRSGASEKCSTPTSKAYS